jgi:hypothetical protein
VAPRLVAASCFVLLALAGCGGDGGGGGGGSNLALPDWPAPPNPMELTRKAGLVPERAEFLQYHVHAHLDVLVDGERVTVPAGIGIDTSNPAVVSDDQGVGLLRECEEPCISPLHTHAEDGILHTETKTPAPNTLGQFFTEWDVALEPGRVGDYSEVKFYVDGEAYDADPREIELSDGREIAIVIGTPPDEIPSEFPQ